MRARVLWVPASCKKKNVDIDMSDLVPYFGTVIKHTPDGRFTHQIQYEDGSKKWHNYLQEEGIITLSDHLPE